MSLALVRQRLRDKFAWPGQPLEPIVMDILIAIQSKFYEIIIQKEILIFKK